MSASELRYEFSEQGLTEALKALGTTPEAVAKNLLAMGFKGFREEPCNCPVANYLLAVITGAVRVNVDCDDAMVGDLLDESCAAALPRPVQAFVADFDNAYMYPELEASDAAA